MQQRESTRSGQSKNRRILAQCHETRAVDDGAIDGAIAILHHAHVGEIVGAQVEILSAVEAEEFTCARIIITC